MLVRDLIPILQVAIGPVILISGIGLLLLSMTNRFGRVIDRARQLAASLEAGSPEQRERAAAQVQILSERGRLVRLAITFASLSLLLAALLIAALFLTALLRWESAVLLAGLFVACLLMLVASILLFIRDINLSLAALKLELGGDWKAFRRPAGPPPRSPRT
ncbi:MAG TPA: DUF2721 domain-containing protein [Vicinamibacteria bacterium]|nr:DUF2721 domain-containing protein [Vicinamibacteria bacterium]